MTIAARSLFAALTLVTAAVLSGCTINIGTAEPGVDSHGNHMMGDSQTSEYGPMDIMFAQMMIPHHEQAVEMSALAPGRAQSPEVLQLAAEIAQEQDPEILQMQAWLDKSGADRDMGHEMHMGGMLSEEELQQLENSTGAEFEELFLKGMIEHHEGAIDMAQMIIDSDNQEVRALAESIISSQTAQIEYMQELLNNY